MSNGSRSRTRYVIAGVNGIRRVAGGENSIKVKSFHITSPCKFALLISPIRTGGAPFGGGRGGVFLFFSTSIRSGVSEFHSGGHRGFRETFRGGGGGASTAHQLARRFVRFLRRRAASRVKNFVSFQRCALYGERVTTSTRLPLPSPVGVRFRDESSTTAARNYIIPTRISPSHIPGMILPASAAACSFSRQIFVGISDAERARTYENVIQNERNKGDREEEDKTDKE